MSNESERLGHDIDQVKSAINQLRDEIRVRLHLGAMDARDAFHELEHELEHLGGDFTRASRQALELTQARLKKLSAAFRDTPKP